MPLQVAGQVGPSAVNAQDGANVDVRQGHTGELVIQQLHGRYFETMARGAVYSAANQAAQAVSVALATTYTGLMVYNPIGSGVMLVLNKVKAALAAAPVAVAPIGLISGVQTAAPTGLTALTVRSNQVGNASAGKGVAYSAATIATPVWHQMLEGGFTAGALPPAAMLSDLEGMIGIIPGGFVAIGAVTAISIFGSVAWEEVPFNVGG